MSFDIQHVSRSLGEAESQVLNSLKQVKSTLDKNICKADRQLQSSDQTIKNFTQELFHLENKIEENREKTRNLSDFKLDETSNLIKEVRNIRKHAKAILKNSDNASISNVYSEIEQMQEVLQNYKRFLSNWQKELVKAEVKELKKVEDVLQSNVQELREYVKHDVAKTMDLHVANRNIKDIHLILGQMQIQAEPLSVYQTPHCYGQELIDDKKLAVLAEEIRLNSSGFFSKPKLPPLAKIGTSSSLVHIERMKRLCVVMKQILAWKYNQNPNLFYAAASPIFQFYMRLNAFQEYLENDAETIKDTYLGQAKDIASQLHQCFLHHLTLGEQRQSRDYFKKFQSECQRFDKKFS